MNTTELTIGLDLGELRATIDGAAPHFVERGEFTCGGRVQAQRTQLLAVLGEHAQ